VQASNAHGWHGYFRNLARANEQQKQQEQQQKQKQQQEQRQKQKQKEQKQKKQKQTQQQQQQNGGGKTRVSSLPPNPVGDLPVEIIRRLAAKGRNVSKKGGNAPISGGTVQVMLAKKAN